MIKSEDAAETPVIKNTEIDRTKSHVQRFLNKESRKESQNESHFIKERKKEQKYRHRESSRSPSVASNLPMMAEGVAHRIQENSSDPVHTFLTAYDNVFYGQRICNDHIPRGVIATKAAMTLRHF